MTLTFLGTGTSIGVPVIGCQCETCRSTDARDKRLRASAIVETDEGLRILIDCGPDFRYQVMRFSPTLCDGSWPSTFGKFDAVLITHIHYDHVGGMDDLRPFAWFGDVDVYGQQDVCEGLRTTMPYCFRESLYPGVPKLNLHTIEAGKPISIARPHSYDVRLPDGGSDLDGTMHHDWFSLTIPAAKGTTEVMPIPILHGKLPILGFRIGKLAYITDMKSATPDTLSLLQGVEVLVVNALRFEKEHHSHQLVHDAIDFARQVGAKRTYLTHLTHDIGTHDAANAQLPEGIFFAYDNQSITI